MRTRRIEAEDLLRAIVELVDDGFAPRHALAARFPRSSRRDLVKASSRLATQGLLLERRGTDGGTYVALTAEGWNALGGAREGRS